MLCKVSSKYYWVLPHGGSYEPGEKHDLRHEVVKLTTLSNDSTNVKCGFAEFTVPVHEPASGFEMSEEKNRGEKSLNG